MFFLIVFLFGANAHASVNEPVFPSNDGGIYGEWTTDRFGLPAFLYTFDQLTDPRSPWPHSEEIFPSYPERRDHFHLFGNHRVNVMAVDHGYVQLFGNERGPTWMNRFSEEQQNLGGGFSYIGIDGGESFCTASLYAPALATVKRVFGMGYYETETIYETNGAHLRIVHQIFAPFGDDSLVMDEVKIENLSDRKVSLSHYEFWDVNRHQLQTEWIRSGRAAQIGDAHRERLNARFLQKVDRKNDVLKASMRVKPGLNPPPSEAISSVDWYPPDIFLAALIGEVDEVYTDQTAFFGSGTPSLPEAVLERRPGELLSERDAYGQPAALIMRSDLNFAPQEIQVLRFAYGYLPEGKTLGMLDAYRDPNQDLLAASVAQWKPYLAQLTVSEEIPQAALLNRETLWRSYHLQASSVYLDYYGTHVIPQGSAYLYLHGADGAPRDQSLFTLSSTYLNPPLAKEMLRVIMKITDAKTGAITYAFTGHGVNEDATIHRYPSDLDLFFLMALGEYLAATGDFGFLREEVDFHPRDAQTLPPGAQGKTVLDHVRAAFWHLKNAVGLGPHGLFRIWDGDWSDAIVYEDLSPLAIHFTIQSGESVPNSQMAIVVLPLIADLLESVDASLSTAMRNDVQTLTKAVRQTYRDRWFGRAWLKNRFNQPYLKGNDQERDIRFQANYIDLEAQPWGILANILSNDDRERLLNEIEARLDEDSPIGPRLRPQGMVWPAISHLMTWAYARYRPQSAWRSLIEHLYATHAAQFPDIWMGILSGPDGFYSTLEDDPKEQAGGTWASPFTPMTDFPVANMNPDSMWILGLLRTAGIEPASQGLSISPSHALTHYSLDLPLLKLAVEPNRISGIYRAQNDGALNLLIHIPQGIIPKVRLNAESIPAIIDNGQIVLPLTFYKGENVDFEVEWD